MVFPVDVIVGLAVIAVLLVVSALISGSEVAFFALRPVDIAQLRNKKNRVSRTAKDLLDQPEKLLATILIANNFVNVGIVILSTWVSHNIFDFSSNPALGFILQTIVITFIILLVGEIVPKVYASRFSLKFVFFMALPIKTLSIIFKPLAAVLIRSTSAVQKRLKDHKSNISMDDLSQALELTGEELDDDEKILKGIVNFGTTDVREIMKPRVDVVAVDIATSFSKLLNMITETGYSRIPVFIKDFDHIKGILYVKDLLPHIVKSNSFRWQSLIRPPYFVPENKKINDLLEEFQKQKIHLALIVDEYGGTSGLVTLEDILEEIVGEISDESDEEEVLYSRINDKTYLFKAKILLIDFYKILDLPDEVFSEVRGEAETLAGLILEMTGEIPGKNERFTFKEFEFVIDEVDQRRIVKVRVKVP
ncbi:MAG: gliding motility-associated protein GldE [Bacteroidetes bacterium]|jgi:putative hemolysin|nr:gliding motility-associated protein GldE [Bacteroidota bacterium]MBT3749737.1 gliding motility-associated protein GldE [Bacteroidota bacterium]MBT4398166.1 gliding motility-associated protein GldE [Bacteroidota bacterium]MBT4410033.1 gliding motility-associated protein GldE [Bacteroidota bacterium]MBT7092326.1 gliding motility-associated protein GldE [Bacteroidota bacterium]